MEMEIESRYFCQHKFKSKSVSCKMLDESVDILVSPHISPHPLSILDPFRTSLVEGDLFNKQIKKKHHLEIKSVLFV